LVLFFLVAQYVIHSVLTPFPHIIKVKKAFRLSNRTLSEMPTPSADSAESFFSSNSDLASDFGTKNHKKRFIQMVCSIWVLPPTMQHVDLGCPLALWTRWSQVCSEQKLRFPFPWRGQSRAQQ
jgi:hypothetical protein